MMVANTCTFSTSFAPKLSNTVEKLMVLGATTQSDENSVRWEVSSVISVADVSWDVCREEPGSFHVIFVERFH